MISIRKSVNELDRLEHLRKVCQDGYVNAIRAASDYTVELDRAQVADLRRNLSRICEQLEAAAEPEDYHAVQANLRGELRLYRDLAERWLEKMSEELRASAAAMQSLAGDLMSNGDDHEAMLNSSLRSLATVQESEDLLFIKRVTREAAVSITESWDQLRRANQLVTAQLRDEIRSLHREIDNERRSLYTDPASGAWTRDKLNVRIEDNLRGNDAFCLLVATVTNLKRLRAGQSQTVIDGVLRAMVKRIHGTVGKDAIIGRWSEDQFGIMVELEPGHAMKVATEIGQDLSAPYSVQENGIARAVTLRVNTSVVARPLGSDPANFREKLTQLDLSPRP